MKDFFNLLWAAFQSVLMKCVSFKNLVFGFGTYVGMKVAFRLDANFMEWASYQMGLLGMFYASNQFQKWLFAKNPPSLPPTVHPIDEQ